MRRPFNLRDVWKNERYLRMFAIADKRVIVEVEHRGATDAPEMRYSILSDALTGCARAA